MTRTRILSVIGGGVLAGAVLNVGGSVIQIFTVGNAETTAGSVLGSFVVGVVAVWLYASLRSERGPKTALVAGVVTWVLVYGMVNFAMWRIGVFNGPLMLAYAAIGLCQVTVATLVGAWVTDWAEFVGLERTRKPANVHRFTPPSGTLTIQP
jgi:hypothetical protein